MTYNISFKNYAMSKYFKLEKMYVPGFFFLKAENKYLYLQILENDEKQNL